MNDRRRKTRTLLGAAAGIAVLVGCGAGAVEEADGTPPPAIAADITREDPTEEPTSAEPTSAEPSHDPVAACSALFDGGADSVATRVATLLGDVPNELDRENAQPYLVMESELRAIAEATPLDMVELLDVLREPFAAISSAMTTGGEQVASDTSSIAEAVSTLSEECIAAGYEMPKVDDSPYGERVTSSRGNLVKEVGQLSGILSRHGETIVDFAVTQIDVDFTCTSSYSEPASNGHYVGLRLEIRSHPELADEGLPEFWMTEHDFTAWDHDGKRVNDPVGNGYSCLSDSDALPRAIGPDETVTGWIVLDLPDASGVIGYSWIGVDSGAGWEWVYGEG